MLRECANKIGVLSSKLILVQRTTQPVLRHWVHFTCTSHCLSDLCSVGLQRDESDTHTKKQTQLIDPRQTLRGHTNYFLWKQREERSPFRLKCYICHFLIILYQTGNMRWRNVRKMPRRLILLEANVVITLKTSTAAQSHEPGRWVVPETCAFLRFWMDINPQLDFNTITF